MKDLLSCDYKVTLIACKKNTNKKFVYLGLCLNNIKNTIILIDVLIMGPVGLYQQVSSYTLRIYKFKTTRLRSN